MKLKYIITLVLFFGNLMAIYMNQLSNELSRSIMMTDRQRLLLRMNQMLICLLLVMMAVLAYMAVAQK